MIELKKLVKDLTGAPVIEALADVLRENDPDFEEVETKYYEAVIILDKMLRDKIEPSVEDYLKACERDVIANVLYAAYLGYKANLDNFQSPTGNNFVKEEYSILLKEHTIGTFPIHTEIERTVQAFRHALPTEYHSFDEDIFQYFLTLDMAGPKLAHYAGYVLSNELLPLVEPGYRKDYIQTNNYAAEVQKYFGYLPIQ